LFALLAIAHVLTGSPPPPDASGEEILQFISTNEGMHTAQVIVSVLGLLPLAVFVAGLLMPFRASDGQHGEGWATSILIGAVTVISSIAIGDTFLYGLFLRGGEGSDPAIVRLLWDIELVAYAGAGLGVAVMLGSSVIPVFKHKVFPAWHGWLSLLFATLGVSAVIDVVSISAGGVINSMATLGFAVVWVLATSVLLWKTSKPAVTSTEQSLGSHTVQS
jgi:hypothetical protein